MPTLLCVDCKHCVWVESVDLVTPFCDNPATKTDMFDVPIGFLSETAKACALFETAEQKDRLLVPSL